MNEGKEVELFCHVTASLGYGNENWKTCTWSRNSDGENCRLEYKKTDSKNGMEISRSCSGLIADYPFYVNSNWTDVGNQVCGIIIPSASQLDNADWTCRLMQCKKEILGGCGDKDGNDNTVEATINVKVVNDSLM